MWEELRGGNGGRVKGWEMGNGEGLRGGKWGRVKGWDLQCYAVDFSQIKWHIK